jgi:hypothetical protein
MKQITLTGKPSPTKTDSAYAKRLKIFFKKRLVLVDTKIASLEKLLNKPGMKSLSKRSMFYRARQEYIAELNFHKKMRKKILADIKLEWSEYKKRG